MSRDRNILIGVVAAIGLAVLVAVLATKRDRGDNQPTAEKGHDNHESEETGHARGGEADGGHKETEGEVELGDDQTQAAGIELATAGPGTIGKEVVFPAEIKLNADNVAHIFPRFAGVIRQVRKTVGDNVKKGEVLAIIESNESLTNYEIKSLVDGTIIERHVTLGEMIREDAECFVVADLSSVWVDINVYPKDLPLVMQGSAVRVRTSNSEAETLGKVAFVGPIVSEHTRTALARVLLPNPDGAWKPGIFVTARVMANPVEVALVVTRDAIQTINGEPSVFVETETGAFRAQAVKLGRKSEKEIEVLAGMKSGDRYVAKGTFILKAELGKSEAEHSHD